MPCLPGFWPVMKVAQAVELTLGMLVSIWARAPSRTSAARLGSSPAANCRCRYDHGTPSSPSTTTRGLRWARLNNLTADSSHSLSRWPPWWWPTRRRPGSQVAEVAQALLDLLFLLLGVHVLGGGLGGRLASGLVGGLGRVLGSIGHRAITSPRMPSGTGRSSMDRIVGVTS